MSPPKTEKKVSWTRKWRNKYRLVFMTDDTLEERFTFRLSRMNVFIALGTLAIILIFLTSILIAFTPLREYIPGYTNVGLTKRLYKLQMKTDSIERDLIRKEQFLNNLRDVINGKDFVPGQIPTKDTMRRYKDIKLKRSPEDSLLRLDMENQTRYSLYKMESKESPAMKKTNIGSMVFFTPVKGIITNKFDPARNHLGIDVVSKQNEAVKAVLDGTVILAAWTVETGYVIMVSHSGNVVSTYKHNSALLKKSGDYVKAGEPIAIIGQTGELVTGPHLHFELWNDGNPVNPQEYIKF
ncbi:MAG: M23 family metallopeptidase [Bacteroidales bacterium]|nr:M23 family metallopeptidase [Bacteroidales bacterium]HNW75004.1 M23 family metallopeptidase [Bacteroidales bacterium]HPS49375.1 M23 family metallopeptidase [Bacteroidales bacterium]